MATTNDDGSSEAPTVTDAENRERQEAEFEFIEAAYSPDEAWVVLASPPPGNGGAKKNHGPRSNQIHRRLELPLDDHDNVGDGNDDGDDDGSPSRSGISVELILTLPLTYPSDERAPLEINASLMSRNSRNIPSKTQSNHVDASMYRKLAMDSLPNLLQACRGTALETAGTESVFVVLSRAEQWIDEDWSELRRTVPTSGGSNRNSSAQHSSAAGTTNDRDKLPLFLGRKLIYSHHIIAKAKRKAISDLAKDYQLGGFFKIGWPGIIVIEGEEENCNSFCDEIRSMRWQYLVIRGEEREAVPAAATALSGNTAIADKETTETRLSRLRKFPLQMKELGEDQMSHLSEICRKVGLEDLFLTSMKIYNRNSNTGKGSRDEDDGEDEDETNTNTNTTKSHKNTCDYGTLVLVDHMNDPKGYTKWIRKTCQSSGCRCAVLASSVGSNEDPARSSGSNQHRPTIFVALYASEASSVKQVLKRWRTSKVDIDSRGTPCLERKMDILVEGELPIAETGPTMALASFASSLAGCSLDSSSSKNNPGKPPSETTIYTVIDNENNRKMLTIDQTESLLHSIGGSPWKETFRGTTQNRPSGGSKSKAKGNTKR